MKREVLVHFLYFASFFILASVVKGWLDIKYWPFWVGGVLGTILPYADHLVYIYFLKPYELSSQRINKEIEGGRVIKAFDLLVDTAHERSKLIFHTVYFQLIFVVLTFLVVSSSTSILGRGLVLAFYLHLIIDQIEELFSKKNIFSWFQEIDFISPEDLTYKRMVAYTGANLLALLLFGFLF